MVSKRGQAVLISLREVAECEHAFPCGALAQLGERLICIQEVIGSIPIGSTISCRLRWGVANSVVPDMKTTVPAFERVSNEASASFIGTLTL